MNARARAPAGSTTRGWPRWSTTPSRRQSCEQRAHPEDWPLAIGVGAAGLPAEIWDRALGDVARDILSRPSRQFRARLAELGFRLAGGARQPAPLAGRHRRGRFTPAA